MTTHICEGCQRVCPTSNALRMHRERNHANGQWLCRIKKEKRNNKTKLKQAKSCVAELNPIAVMDTVNEASKANELLYELRKTISEMKEQNSALSEEHFKLITKHETLVKQIKKQDVSIAKPVMTQPRRLQIAARQEWKCNTCTKTLSSVFEIDHMIPWNVSYDDSDENLQALCVECHKLKTAEDNTKR